MEFDNEGFDPSVSLPPQLTISQLRLALDWVEVQTSELVEIYAEQRNVFSAIVGIFGTKAIDTYTSYKKHKHPDVAQQRFPDLSLGGSLNPSPKHSLESKASTRSAAIQSHYNHAGWYIVFRYMVDLTAQVKKGRFVVIWGIDIPFLTADDWKYEGSGAAEGKGGRTHTFGVRAPGSRLASSRVYRYPRVVLQGGKPVLK